MAGHMGDAHVTVTNLHVIESDPAKGLLFIEGAVPGGKNGLLRIRLSAKTGTRPRQSSKRRQSKRTESYR